MTLPKISIITVTYNAASVLEDTILSVLNQTYNNIEYIVIDGGSTDGSVDIIKKYQDKITYWVSEPDNGIYDAMNKGLSIASGDWVLFMGGDDVFYQNISLNICSIFKDNNIYYGDVILKTSASRYPGKITSAYRLSLINFSHQSIFYPSSIYKKYNYDLDYKLWADYVYNLNLFRTFRHNFIYLNSIITIFNDQGRGSLNQDKLFLKNRLSLISHLFGKRLAFIMSIRYKLSYLKNGF